MKKETNRDEVFRIVKMLGFEEDGIVGEFVTYKRNGGEYMKHVRGRDRLYREKDNQYCTVGSITTNFYRRKGIKAIGLIGFKTKDTEAIYRYAKRKRRK